MTTPTDTALSIRYGAPHTPTQAERDAQASLLAVQGIATRLGLPWTVTQHAGRVVVHVEVDGVRG